MVADRKTLLLRAKAKQIRRHRQSQRQPQDLSWGEVGSQALENLGPSAKQFASDMTAIVRDPKATVRGVGNVLLGTMQLAVPGEQGSEKYAEQVGRFFANRYGGMENLKKTIATDPVGFLADASAVLTLGGGAAARAPGMLGTVGRVARTTGTMVDPIMAPAKVASKVGGAVVSPAVSGILGLTTGAHSEPIRIAASAGKTGGELGKRFRDAMRGDLPLDQVVTEARTALGNMYTKRAAAYRSGMSGIKGDPTILSFDGVDKAMAGVTGVKRFKGVDIAPKTANIRKEINDAITDWKKLDPAEYHTVEGFDALKQKIGDIRESVQYGTPERKVADAAYHAVRDQILKQAPEYGKVMKQYWQATDELDNIQKSLSLGKKASAETALRKLQSIVRNDVSSAYGKRADYAKVLEEAGAPGLSETMAGQALRDLMPRGLSRVGALGIGGGGMYFDPLAAGGYLAASSPRLVGEAAHAAGRASGMMSKVPPATLPLMYQLQRSALLNSSGIPSADPQQF